VPAIFTARSAGGPVGKSLSGCLLDADTREVLAAVEPDVVRPTASVGKVLLLIAIAQSLANGRLDPDRSIPRLEADAVADSGLWQHLQQSSLSVVDLAVLVGAVSDNLATNVLLRLVGVSAAGAVADMLDLKVTRLHDRVRDVRGPQDPPTLSTGSAVELAGLFGRLHRAEVVGSAVGTRVLDWLNLDTDTSMVAGAFGLDPLAHAAADRGRWLAHKTGTDVGVRADVGLLRGPLRSVAYAVLAEFDDGRRDEVLAEMRDWGLRIVEFAG